MTAAMRLLALITAFSQLKQSHINTTAQSDDEINQICYDGSRNQADEWFENFVSPTLSPDEFFSDYWMQKPIVLKTSEDGINNHSSILSLDELGELLDADARHTSKKRLLRSKVVPLHQVQLGKTKPGYGRVEPPQWQIEGTQMGNQPNPGAKKYMEYYKKGWSIVLNQVYAFWEPAYRLVSQVERYFEVPASGNIYITPPGSKGFAVHFDNANVFFCQISGRKRWRVYAPLVSYPVERSSVELENMPKARAKPLLDVVLNPGETLYIPSGFLHEGTVAPGEDEGSIHLTFSPEVVTWYEFFMRSAIGPASGQPEPPGRAVEEPLEEHLKWTKQWRMGNTQGVPLSLRKTALPILSKYCGTETFQKEMILALKSLDPDRSTYKRVKRVLEERLGTDGMEAACKDFLIKILPEFVSREANNDVISDGKTSEDSDGKEVLCVSSTVAARLQSYHRPGEESNEMLAYSTENGPDVRIRYNYDEGFDGKEKSSSAFSKGVPEWAIEPLSSILHPEHNPSGVVKLQKVFGDMGKEKRKQVDKMIDRLVKLGILEQRRQGKRWGDDNDDNVNEAKRSESSKLKEEEDEVLTSDDTYDNNAEEDYEEKKIDENTPSTTEQKTSYVEKENTTPTVDNNTSQVCKPTPTSHEQKSSTLRSLLGDETDVFLSSIWQKKNYHHFKSSPSSPRDHTYLWSLALMTYYIKPDKPAWGYEEDIKLVKEGDTYFTSKKPAKWSDIRKALSEGGASLVSNNIHQRHAPLYELMVDLEINLGIWAATNAYVTPQSTVGFAPHWDNHDFFVLQVEGEKQWTICERREVDYEYYRMLQRTRGHQGGYNIFNMEDQFEDCEHIVLRPGDILYMKYGTIHYAKGVGGTYSHHITISLDRPNMDWGTFFKDVADPQDPFKPSPPPQHKDTISAITSKSDGLQVLFPRLRELRNSINNDDLPAGYLDDIRTEALSLVSSEFSSASSRLQKHLRKNIEDGRNGRKAMGMALQTMRQRVTVGSLKKVHACFGTLSSASSKKLGGVLRYRRVPEIGIVMVDLDDFVFLGTNVNGDDTHTEENGQHQFSPDWKDGIFFALASYAEGTAKGDYFTLEDMTNVMKGNKRMASKIIKELGNACVLEMKRDALELGG